MGLVVLKMGLPMMEILTLLDLGNVTSLLKRLDGVLVHDLQRSLWKLRMTQKNDLTVLEI